MAEYHKGAYRQGMEIDPVAARPLGGTGGRAYICLLGYHNIQLAFYGCKGFNILVSIIRKRIQG